MVEITIHINRLIENIVAAGTQILSLDECRARLQIVGFEQRGEVWRCPTTLLKALESSEYQVND